MQTTQPEQSGFSAARFQRLNALFQGYIDRSELAGMSACVARAGKTVYAEPFGHKDIEAHQPLQFDTIFMIASMTKAITSVAVMMLYEEGHFNLNTPLPKFIPAFRDTKVWAGQTETGYETTDLGRRNHHAPPLHPHLRSELWVQSQRSHRPALSGEW